MPADELEIVPHPDGRSRVVLPACIVKGDAFDAELGAWENYADYIDRLRGDL